MPCETCNIQFTVFKRRRNCSECQRNYCSQCLVKRSSSLNLCGKCLIFTKRPLLKVDLQNLKPKDLIFYLQLKHISTKGCVEKDELITLVLTHANCTDATSDNRKKENQKKFLLNSFCNNKINTQEHSNPFDQIKQSCNNFFNNFTEKICTDLNFSNDNTISTYAKSSTAGTSKSNDVAEQAQRDTINGSNSLRLNSNLKYFVDDSSFEDQSFKTNTIISTPSSASSGLNSPKNTISNRSLILESANKTNEHDKQKHVDNYNEQPDYIQKSSAKFYVTNKNIFKNLYRESSINEPFKSLKNGSSGNNSGCECSDDEILANFEATKNKPQSSSKIGLSYENLNFNLSVDKENLYKVKKYGESESSSYDELGAVGGINTSKNNGDIVSLSDSFHWHFIENDCTEQSANKTSKDESVIQSDSLNDPFITNLAIIDDGGLRTPWNSEIFDIQQQHRIVRRRSDGYEYKSEFINCHETTQTDPNFEIHIPLQGRGNASQTLFSRMSSVDEVLDIKNLELNVNNREKFKKTCSNCGKSKKILKKQILKFRKHLENSNITEEELKEELKLFLMYLENRSKSFDVSEDSEDTNREYQIDLSTLGNRLAELHYETAAAAAFLDDNEGIQIYARNYENSHLKTRSIGNRFLNLSDFQTKEEINDLTVKQLKDILMLNRIDYKGCCEKHELLERVFRLWNNQQDYAAVEKLRTDDLCKICMDAPIECVILECGHLATCTNCGKVLNECPICRQYIVRVVRFFRA